MRKIVWKVHYEEDAIMIIKRIMDKFAHSGDNLSISYELFNNGISATYEISNDNEYEIIDIKEDIENYLGFVSE